MQQIRKYIGTIGAICFFLMVSACQPDPESRMTSARSYAAAGEYYAAAIELRNVLSAQPENIEARLLLADTSLRIADYLSAEKEFEKAHDLGYDGTESWVGLGRSILSQGRSAEVIDGILPRLTATPSTEGAAVLAGDAYLVQEEIGAASAAYEEALAINPGSANALVGLAAVAERQSNFVLARAKLAEAAVADPDSSRVWVSTGNFHAKRLEANAGIGAFRRAIEIDSTSDPTGMLLVARMNLVLLLLDFGRMEAASEEVAEFAADFPNYPVLHFLRGRVALGRGELDLAQSELQKYTSLVPRDRRGQAVLGMVHFSQNHLMQAEMYLTQAVREDVGGDAARRLLAETQLRLDKPDLAMSLLESSVSQPGGKQDSLLFAMLGRAQAGLGNSEIAADYYEHALADRNADGTTIMLVASGLLSIGRPERAITALESLDDDAVDDARRDVLLITAHLSRQDDGKATDTISRMIDESPDDPAAHVVAGTVYLHLQQARKAKSYFERALQLDGDNVEALFGLSRCAKQQGDKMGSRDFLVMALERRPAYVPALVALSESVQLDDESEVFWTFVDEAIDHLPDQPGLRIFAMKFANSRREYERSTRIAAEAENAFPSHAGILHAKGVALYESGSQRDGLSALAKALRLEPDNTPIRVAYASGLYSSAKYSEALEVLRSRNSGDDSSFDGLLLEFNSLLHLSSLKAARQLLIDSRDKFSGDNRLDVLFGDLAFEEGRADRALEHYEKAVDSLWSRELVLRMVSAGVLNDRAKAVAYLRKWLASHPEDNGLRLLYGQLLKESGDKSSALLAYEELLRADPENVMALNNLAWEYALAGREDAVGLAEKAHRLDPQNGAVTDTLGWIYYLNERYDDAVSMLTTASGQSPNNTEVQFHLAAALAKTGSHDAAQDLLQRILASDLEFPSRSAAESLAQSL